MGNVLHRLQQQLFNTQSSVDEQLALRHDQELDERRQEWLEQQKMAWLEEQRTDWEVAGKPVPWAEWQGEQEYRWAVNELPNRELAWARCIAERERTAIEQQEL
jgi:hypothetical protein